MREEKLSFFDKFQDTVTNKVVPLATKLSEQRHLSAIKDSMTLLIPLTIIGGFSILLASPPIGEDMQPTNIFFQFLLMWKAWATANNALLMVPFNLTLGVISVYVVAGLAFNLSKLYKLDPIVNTISALFIFLCVSAAPVAMQSGQFMPTSELGASGMFAGIIIAIAVVEINNFLIKKNIKIKMPDSVPPMVSAPFEVLIPLIFNTLFFLALNAICMSATGAGLSQLIFKVFQPLLSATGSLPSVLFLTMLCMILWFFGIHGDNMISPIITPIITLNVALNLEAYQSGRPMEYILSGQFMGVWSTWVIYTAILISIFIVAKSAQLRSLIKIAPFSTMFNINEPLVFGVPTVLNIYTLIPILICVVIDISASYLLTALDVIGKIYLLVPWTTPAVIAAFLSTMDWKAPLLWIALLVSNVVIILPFIKKYDLQLLEKESQSQSE